MKLKLTKKKAEEFAKSLCGSSKGLIQDISEGSWILTNGHMNYNFWLSDGRIYLQISVANHCVSSYFFDYLTYEPDFDYTDNYRKKYKEEEYNQDKVEFLLWLREDSKYKINIPDALIDNYRYRW